MAGFKDKFESAKQDWETPKWLFERLDAEFDFQVDVAATEENALCEAYFTAEENALNYEWRGRCWLNPPYGESAGTLRDWVKKAYEEGQYKGTTVVCLLPARTNTRWWHDYVMRSGEIRFICGRPKFGDAEHGLLQPLAIVVFNGFFPPNLTSFYC